ncbi:phospholipase-D-like protein [Cotia virus SPAn232]|uniref:Phospholipase-D-like protein n=2 Tax=Cotia virus TaxID=39444 RepID=H6TAC9_9POXV|nr:phospholipase-D-like protein [Cotia virus SPAn232]AFB76963.1 phospholipase-D-like protein [Cotia virus SPAn232]AIT70776.1 phospholipase-D-like protein [Cotia virus]
MMDYDISCYDVNSRAEITETIPTDLTFEDNINTSYTFKTWMTLLENATSSVYISSFYWSLVDERSKNDPTSIIGYILLKKLILKASMLDMYIVVNKSGSIKYENLIELEKAGAKVIYVDINNIFPTGVLHTKFWIVDNKHVYIGSANMDWRSLTQVKELGITIYNNSCIANELTKIFNIYKYIGINDTVMFKWNLKEFYAEYNMFYNLSTKINGVDTKLYISSSPRELCSLKTTFDLDAIIRCIRTARKFIYISVMNYIPIIYTKNGKKYWEYIDIELRRAIINKGISVKLLVSNWIHTDPVTLSHLKSIMDIGIYNNHESIEVKWFKVPSRQVEVPYTRVNHSKFMVTDIDAYIGTSNWSGNYFVDTAGVSIVLTPNDSTGIRKQLEMVFLRDWNSSYTHDLDTYFPLIKLDYKNDE